MIKNMDLEHIIGQMVKNILGIGKMAKKMGKEPYCINYFI